ncbi:hypothetical protein, partial [uncultured Sphingomonas sp.]|uniref:hypothetical protein n=1 Tax=uncultured Sphingomonas sp. TaxID=158754 RepID=UPI0025CC909F
TRFSAEFHVNPLYFVFVSARGLDRLTPLFLILSLQAGVRSVGANGSAWRPDVVGTAFGQF